MSDQSNVVSYTRVQAEAEARGVVNQHPEILELAVDYHDFMNDPGECGHPSCFLYNYVPVGLRRAWEDYAMFRFLLGGTDW